jgi:nitroreductase
MKKKTGLLGTMFPPEWLNPDFKFDKDAGNETPVQRSLPACPLMLVVVYDPSKRASASEGDFLGIISLGCAMENMWLMANSLGIGFHIISSLNEETAEKEIKNILKIPKHLKMAFSCRLGYPLSPLSKNLRVRRDINDFASHNTFGNKDLE